MIVMTVIVGIITQSIRQLTGSTRSRQVERAVSQSKTQSILYAHRI